MNELPEHQLRVGQTWYSYLLSFEPGPSPTLIDNLPSPYRAYNNSELGGWPHTAIVVDSSEQLVVGLGRHGLFMAATPKLSREHEDPARAMLERYIGQMATYFRENHLRLAADDVLYGVSEDENGVIFKPDESAPRLRLPKAAQCA